MGARVSVPLWRQPWDVREPVHPERVDGLCRAVQACPERSRRGLSPIEIQTSAGLIHSMNARATSRNEKTARRRFFAFFCWQRTRYKRRMVVAIRAVCLRKQAGCFTRFTRRLRVPGS